MTISTKRRKSLKPSQFGLPAERKYPTDTKKRAANAKARASQGVKAGRLSKSQEAQIDRKADRKLYGKSKAPKGRKS